MNPAAREAMSCETAIAQNTKGTTWGAVEATAEEGKEEELRRPSCISQLSLDITLESSKQNFNVKLPTITKTILSV